MVAATKYAPWAHMTSLHLESEQRRYGHGGWASPGLGLLSGIALEAQWTSYLIPGAPNVRQVGRYYLSAFKAGKKTLLVFALLLLLLLMLSLFLLLP